MISSDTIYQSDTLVPRSICSSPNCKINIKLSQVPEYLRNSELYITLCNNARDGDIPEEESIEIPANCMKQSASVNTLADLESLLFTLRFWMSSALPEELITFCIRNSSSAADSLGRFEAQLSQLEHLYSVTSAMALPADLAKRVWDTNGTCLFKSIMTNEPGYFMAKAAMAPGKPDIMRCLHRYYDEQQINPWSIDICAIAARLGNLDCLQYAHENGCEWNHYTCSAAAGRRHMHCLQYAHENGCEWGPGTCLSAASSGNLDCLKYAHENGCEWSCISCASARSLDILQYLHENGCPWNCGTTFGAASRGNLDCLKYAHENGCAWHPDTCDGAASAGHLDCLKYAHENGCPWNNFVCIDAALSGNLDCLRYAIENGCACNCTACCAAARSGNVDCLINNVHDNGCKWDYERFINWGH